MSSAIQPQVGAEHTRPRAPCPSGDLDLPANALRPRRALQAKQSRRAGRDDAAAQGTHGFRGGGTDRVGFAEDVADLVEQVDHLA